MKSSAAQFKVLPESEKLVRTASDCSDSPPPLPPYCIFSFPPTARRHKRTPTWTQLLLPEMPMLTPLCRHTQRQRRRLARSARRDTRSGRSGLTRARFSTCSTRGASSGGRSVLDCPWRCASGCRRRRIRCECFCATPSHVTLDPSTFSPFHPACTPFSLHILLRPSLFISCTSANLFPLVVSSRSTRARRGGAMALRTRRRTGGRCRIKRRRSGRSARRWRGRSGRGRQSWERLLEGKGAT